MMQETEPVTYEERFWAKVDKNGPMHPVLGTPCWLWTASVMWRGYGQFQLNGTMARAHRLSYLMANGSIQDKMQIDHICHNKRCVNPGHLRPATNKQNHENLAGPPSNNTSGVRGVSLFKRTGKWVAYVSHHGLRIHLGYFDTLADAEAAVITKRNELFTHNYTDRVNK